MTQQQLAHGLSAPSTSNNKSKYYSYKTYKRMQLPALAYSAVTKAASRLLRLAPMEIPPSSTTTDTDDDDTSRRRRRQVAVVTGSNTGVGYETAKALVQDHGFEVIIACRSQKKGMQACSDINNNMPNNNSNSRGGKAVFVEPLDLADLQSVRDFSRALVDQQYETIDVLINNAGRNSAGPAAASQTNNDSNSSQQQLDLLFQTNFLGHFLLTHQLLDKLKCRRIVNLSSVMHHFPKYSKNDNNKGDNGISSKDFWRSNAVEPVVTAAAEEAAGVVVRKTYAPSKLAAVLFSLELNRRYGESKGLRSIAVNPGSV
jgi:NAD(P)-dependent dehydrogenase (short-subunit alcohol dehydrogenase family)